MGNKIGIGITVHNRPGMASLSVEQWRQYAPEGSKIVVVDDASEQPFPGSAFRFEENVGIAVAKNKCLELLEDYDHIFLSDDDFYPVSPNWYLPYITSTLNHACYTFGRKVLSCGVFFTEYEKPCGCLLYMRKICLQAVGGFDTDFKGYGYEHVNYSDRIFNAGLNPARYVDVPTSKYHFNSLDEQGKAKTSISAEIRFETIRTNKLFYDQKFNSSEFKPYK